MAPIHAKSAPLSTIKNLCSSGIDSSNPKESHAFIACYYYIAGMQDLDRSITPSEYKTQLGCKRSSPEETVNYVLNWIDEEYKEEMADINAAYIISYALVSMCQKRP